MKKTNRVLKTFAFALLLGLFLVGCKSKKKVVDTDVTQRQEKSSLSLSTDLSKLTDFNYSVDFDQLTITRYEAIEIKKDSVVLSPVVTVKTRTQDRSVVRKAETQQEDRNETVEASEVVDQSSMSNEFENYDVVKSVTQGFFKGIFGKITRWIWPVFVLIIIYLTIKIYRKHAEKID